MNEIKVEEVRADGLSLFDEVLDVTAEREILLFTVVGLRAVEGAEVEVTGEDGTSFTCPMDQKFYRVTVA